MREIGKKAKNKMNMNKFNKL